LLVVTFGSGCSGSSSSSSASTFTPVLDPQCLAKAPVADAGDALPCTLLVTLPAQGPESDCTKYQGLAVPDPTLLSSFQQHLLAGGDAVAVFKFPVCTLHQLTSPTCKDATELACPP
jgi:hypothetical protein